MNASDWIDDIKVKALRQERDMAERRMNDYADKLDTRTAARDGAQRDIDRLSGAIAYERERIAALDEEIGDA